MLHSSRIVFFIFFFAGCVSAGVITRTPMKVDNLNGHDYEVERLSLQGSGSATYDILEGFRLGDGSRVPAILKVILRGNSDVDAEATKETKYLEAVGLLLFTKRDNVMIYIVMRNARTLQDKPPLKPYHEWYLKKGSKTLDKDLKKLQKNILKKLLKYAKKKKLCYEDVHFLNIFVDEALSKVMPIDWGPAVGKMWGVKEITQPGDEKACKAFLSEIIPEKFNCKSLVDALTHSKNKLWPWDQERSICQEL